MAQSNDPSNASENKSNKKTLSIPKKKFRSAGASSAPKKARGKDSPKPPPKKAEAQASAPTAKPTPKEEPEPQPKPQAQPKTEPPKDTPSTKQTKPSTTASAPTPEKPAQPSKSDDKTVAEPKTPTENTKPPSTTPSADKTDKKRTKPEPAEQERPKESESKSKAAPAASSRSESTQVDDDADLKRYKAKHQRKGAAESPAFDQILGQAPTPPELISDQLEVNGKANNGNGLMTMSIVVAMLCLLGLLGAFIAFELLPEGGQTVPPLHLGVYGGLVFLGIMLPMVLLIMAKNKRSRANTALGKTLLEIAEDTHSPKKTKQLLEETDKSQDMVAFAVAQQQDDINKLRYWESLLAANQPLEAAIPPPIDDDLARLKPAQERIQQLSGQLEDSRWMAHSLSEAARALQRENKEHALPRTLLRVFNTSFKDALIGVFAPLYDGSKLSNLQLVDSESGKTKSKFTRSTFAAEHGLFYSALQTRKLHHIRQVKDDVVHYMDPTIDPDVEEALAIPVYRNELLQFVIIVLGFNTLPPQYEQLIRVSVTMFEKRLEAFDTDREVQSLEKDKSSLQAELANQQQALNQFQKEMQEVQLELVLSQKALTEQVAALNQSALVVELNTDGTIMDVNDLFAEKMGQSRHQLTQHNLDALLAKSNGLQQAIIAQVTGGKVWKGELQLDDGNGTIWMSATISPVRNQKGEVVKIICVLTDITVQKQQSDALQHALDQSEEQAKALAEAQSKMQATQLELKGQISALNESAVVSETNLKGEITTVNRQFLMLSGYEEDELIGQNHRILKSGHQPDQVYNDLWKTISSGNVWHGEFKNRSKDGSMYWVAATIVPVLGTDGKPVKYIGVSFDITAQKLQEEQISTALEISHQQEAELRQSAKELQEAHEEMRATQIEMRGLIGALNNAGIVAETDDKGTITHVNDALMRISGYDKDELIGQNHRIFKSGEHDQAFFTKLWEAISNGDIWRGTFRNKAKNGDDFWLSTTITPVLGFDGKPVKYLAVSFDITGRMHQAAEIEKALASSRKTEIQLEERSQEMKERENYLQSALEQLAEELDRLRKHETFTEELHAYVPAALITRPIANLDSVGFVSSRFEALTGIEIAQLTSGDVGISMFLDADEAKAVQESMQAVSPNNPVYEVHYTLTTLKGELHLFEKGECIFDPNGNLKSVYAFLYQPIAQAQATEQPTDSAFSAHLLSSHAAATVDANGRIAQMTDALNNLTGNDQQPQTLTALAAALQIQIAEDAIAKANENGYWSDLQKPRQEDMPPLTVELFQTPGAKDSKLLLLVTSDPGVVKSKLELEKAEAISDSVSKLGEEVKHYEAELNAMEAQFMDLQVFLDQEIKNLVQFYRNQLDAKDEEIARYRQN